MTTVSAVVPRAPLSPRVPLLLAAAIGLAVPLIAWLGVWWAVAAAAGLVLFLGFLLLGREGDLFSPPILFTLLWVLCATLGGQLISVEQRPWNATVWILVVGAPIAFWLGDLAGRLMTGSVGERLPDLPQRVGDWPLRPLLFGGAAWLLAALVFSVYEWRTVTDGIPLISEDWDKVRMIGGEGYLGRVVHAVAYSSILLAIVVQVALLAQPRMIAWRTVPVWGLWLFSVGLAGLWGSRHTLFIPLAAGAISVHCLRRRLGLGRLFLAGLLAVVFIAGVQFLRQRSVWSESTVAWEEVLTDIGYGGWPPLLAQLHQTVAMNFEILRRLTETFPVLEPHHLGGFSFHWLFSLLPGNQPTLAEWQNVHWNTGFYGTLTSTYIGPIYADFGVFGVALWTAVLAVVMRCLWVSLRRDPTAVKVVWFAYLSVLLVMLPYDNVLVKLSTVLNFIILWMGMTVLGGRRPGGLTTPPPSA